MSEPQELGKNYLKHAVKELKTYKPTVMDQIMYMGELYRADLICKDDYQGYLKLRLNEVFSPDEQKRIHSKMEWWKKRKEEWY